MEISLDSKNAKTNVNIYPKQLVYIIPVEVPLRMMGLLYEDEAVNYTLTVCQETHCIYRV